MPQFSGKKKLKSFKPPVPGDNAEFWTKAMIFYYIYNGFIVMVGLAIIILGGWMIVNGVDGNIDWILKLFGNKSELLNATPGVFLVVIGFLIIIFARSKTEYKKD